MGILVRHVRRFPGQRGFLPWRLRRRDGPGDSRNRQPGLPAVYSRSLAHGNLGACRAEPVHPPCGHPDGKGPLHSPSGGLSPVRPLPARQGVQSRVLPGRRPAHAVRIRPVRPGHALGCRLRPVWRPSAPVFKRLDQGRPASRPWKTANANPRRSGGGFVMPGWPPADRPR